MTYDNEPPIGDDFDAGQQPSPESAAAALSEQVEAMLGEWFPDWDGLRDANKDSLRIFGHYMAYAKLDAQADPDGFAYFGLFGYSTERSAEMRGVPLPSGEQLFIAAFRSAVEKHAIVGRFISKGGSLVGSTLAPDDSLPGRLVVMRHYLPLVPGRTYDDDEKLQFPEAGYLYTVLRDHESDVFMVDGYIFQGEMILRINQYDADTLSPDIWPGVDITSRLDDVRHPAS